MNLYGRGTIDFHGDDMAGAYVVSHPAGGELARIPYDWTDGRDPYAAALAVLGLRRPHMAARALAYVRDGWDDGDPWGSAMMALGDVCDLAAIVGAHIPDSCGYRPAGLPVLSALVDFDGEVIKDPSGEYTDLAYLAQRHLAGELSRDDLTMAARILDRYLDLCKLNGKDY